MRHFTSTQAEKRRSEARKGADTNQNVFLVGQPKNSSANVEFAWAWEF